MGGESEVYVVGGRKQRNNTQWGDKRARRGQSY